MIDAYTKVNARIGVSANNWEIMAYGRNIFDEVAYQQSFDTPVLAGSHTFFMEEGAVFGSSRNLAVLMNTESSRTQLRLGFFLH